MSTRAVTIIGGLVGLFLVRYMIYSPPEIRMWKRFCKQMGNLNWRYLDDFAKTSAGTTAVLGVIAGCVAFYMLRTKYRKI